MTPTVLMNALREHLAAHGLYVQDDAVRHVGDAVRLRLGDLEVTATADSFAWDGHHHPAEQAGQVAELLAEAYEEYALRWLKSMCPGWDYRRDPDGFRALWLCELPQRLMDAGFRAEVAEKTLRAFVNAVRKQSYLAHINGC
ncbi:hypothetical protein [Bailinhaonella thermotolerans]|uniref:Uncharacterized protein n=1 Tax=Bailinhaonella thermotolerans TaxID=1070861 RepID=A0A3A4A690_9ACTN|nr:hypothetical protein [Bailinhaonella thermotolerans]RJL21201.1 hypothetical protein D5H75_37680 [Bailinhaonella thermotolerans]